MKAEWTTKPLKQACGVNRDTLGEDTRSNWEMQYLDISAVDSDGNVAALETHTFANAPSRARRRVRPGDTVISTVRTYLKAIAHFDQPPKNLIASTGFAVLSPSRDVDSRFLWRAVQSHGFVSGVVANSEGVGYPAIAPSRLANLPISFPAIAAQRRIAAYLDAATGKIDRLMSLRRRQMELLREQRAALIQQAVTRGLDPHAPLKDSGLPWLGRIPEHWEMVRMKMLAESLIAGPFGSSITKDMYVQSGFRVYGQEQVIPADFTIGDYFISSEKFREMARYTVSPGDILISCVGSFGKIAVVPPDIHPGIINPRLLRLRPRKKRIVPKYLGTVLRSNVGFSQMQEEGRGGTMDVINIGLLGQLRLPLPTMDEQHEILAHIQRETAKLDALHRSYERQLALLAEYRASLIHECVTGQREVEN